MTGAVCSKRSGPTPPAVPYQGSNLAAHQRAFNKAMSAVRITVEWVFKEVKVYFTTMDYK
eukprot:IDg21776t1